MSHALSLRGDILYPGDSRTGRVAFRRRFVLGPHGSIWDYAEQDPGTFDFHVDYRLLGGVRVPFSEGVVFRGARWGFGKVGGDSGQ
jgi:hypothetical protein